MSGRDQKSSLRQYLPSSFSLHSNADPYDIAQINFPGSIAAAFLHETIEDTKTKEELVQAFGPDAADLAVEVTDDKSLPDVERKRLQVEHAPKLSVRARVIKIADKTFNLRGVLYSPPANRDWQRRREYFDWGKQVVDGMTAPNAELKREFGAVYQKFEEIVRE